MAFLRTSYNGVENDRKIQEQSVSRNTDSRFTPIQQTKVQNQSVYQQNLSQPIQLPQKPETYRSTLGKLKTRGAQDPEGAAQAFQIILDQSQNKSSRFYNPYSQPTNPAIKNIQNMGLDITQLDDDFFEVNSWAKDYYTTSGTTNNVSSPGKKASPEEKFAYEYNQGYKAEQDTKNAEKELAALQEELNYWAKRSDRNYSDEEIISRIDWSKYKTLDKMNQTRLQGTPMELNRAVNWMGEDSLYGMLWAARNNGGTGNVYLDMANSYNGTGNVWKENPEIAAKLDPKSPDFSPYSVGSTDIDDAAVYFGVSSFGENWLNEHQDLAWSQDETERKMYRKVFEAEQTTLKAEQELAELNAWIDKKIGDGKDPDKILSKIDWTKYPTLAAMDKSIGKNGQAGSGDLVALTRGVDYRYADVKKRIEDACAANAAKDDADTTLEGFNPPADTAAATPETAAPVDLNQMPDPFNVLTMDRSSLPAPGTIPGTGSVGGGGGNPRVMYPDESKMENLPLDPNEVGKGKEENLVDREPVNPKNMQVPAGPVAKPPAVPPVDPGTKLTETVANEKVSDAVSTLEDSMTLAEKNYFRNAPGVEYERTRLSMINGPLNPKLWQDKEWAEYNFNRANNKAKDSYVSTSLGSMKLRHDFEELQKQETQIQTEIKKIEEKYGDGIYANEDIPQSINIEAIPGTGMYAQLYFNPETRTYECPALEDNDILRDAIDRNGTIDFDSYYSAVQDAIARNNDHADLVRRAKEKYPDGVPEDMPSVEEYEELMRMRDRTHEDIASKQDAYNQAISELDNAESKFGRTTLTKLRNGFEADDPERIKASLDFIGTFINNEVPSPGTDTLANQLRLDYTEAIHVGEKGSADNILSDITNQIAELDECIKDVQAAMGMFDNIPEEAMQGMQGWLDYLNQQKRQYEYFQFSRDPNFARYVESGEKKDVMQGGSIGLLASEAMTDFEFDIFFAIEARDGIEAAKQYYKDIEPSLLLRTQQNIEANAAELAESGVLGRIANVAEGIFLSPVEVLTSVADMITTAAGQRDPWLRVPGNLSKTAFAETIKEVDNVYGDGIQGKIVKGAYEIAYNRGRSAAIAAVFGPLFPEGTSEIKQAMPIALTAMDDAVQNALDADVEPWKAWTIGAVTFMAESVTEGIELGHINEAFGTGGKLSREAFINWLKNYPLRGFNESLGETANAIIENAADKYLAGDKGEFAQQIEAYKASGYTKEEAEEMAARDQLFDILHTALISFFSPGADVLFVAAGQIKTYSYYMDLAKSQQKQGNNISFRDIRKGEVKRLKAVEEYQKIIDEAGLKRDLLPLYSNERKAEAGSIFSTEDSRQAQTEQYDIDMTVLDGVSGSNPTAVSATVGAVLETGETNKNRAAAAAMNMQDILGGNAVDIVQGIMAGGVTENVDINLLKLGIQYAMLSDNSRARQVLTNENFAKQDIGTQARWIASTVAEDSVNSAVQEQVAAATHDFRVAEAEKNILSTGAADPAIAAQEKASNAARDTIQARDRSEAADGEANAKNEAMVAAANEAIQNPTDENTNAADQARREWEHAENVAESEAAAVPAAEERQRQAEAEAKQVTDETMANIRQQAEAQVREQEVEEANAAAEEAARQQEEQERQVAAQAEADIQSGLLSEEQAREKAEQNANAAGLTGEERDAFIQRVMDRREKIALRNADMNTPVALGEDGELSNTDGLLAVRAFERKTGLTIKLEDMPQGFRGSYANGVVTLNKNMIQQGNMTYGQALVEAALHEITHAFEGSKSYDIYQQTVKGILFGNKNATYDNNAKLRAAVDYKISEYAKAGKTLTREGAEKEVIADYARTDLHKKESVQRFMDAGLGGQMRNTLHNINQALKNLKLTGEERTKAENLRRAERAYQKAMTELAKTKIHPEAEQFSISQFAQATGTTFDENTLTLYDRNGKEIDGVKNKVTTDMINETPVGKLIDQGLTGEQNTKAKEMMTGLMNMVARYKDSNLVWEIGASTLSSTFSALKSNSDPQYATTVDFGTVCAKTQAIIDVMSQVMLDRVKQGKSGGLTRDEIMKVYNETHKAGLSVPCPVCYVFSRWMGVPSLLGQMSQFQNDYVVQDANNKIDTKATQAKVDAYLKNAEQYGDAKAINNRKTQLQGQRAKLEQQRTELETQLESKVLTEEARENLQKRFDDVLAQMVELDKQIDEVSAYNWITQALCKKENGKYVVDPKFRVTPDEILFDLNRTGEFAGYAKNWKYRNTRGAGMGKAIMPYSGETIGDILYGVKASGRQAKNPWLNMDDKAAARQLKNAQDRAKKQNLVGGQRLQSTSDFRPEWGLDYIMSFLELQAAKSKVQMYTKVADAVDFFASVGADVNLSIMGQGQGWHVDENGNKVLDFSSVTGMDYETAKALKNKYNNVQMILVGMNDTHIRLAMANEDIDFIIPWHSSGNSQDTLKKLIGSLGEKLITGTDYSETQTDKVSTKRTEEQKTLWDARMKILMGKANDLTLAEREAAYANPYLKDLYHRFYEDETSDCYHVRLNKAQANQIFPYEYWDTSLTKEKADENGRRFVEYCEAMGIVPRFSQFKDDTGYWKLLIDRPMYNNDGSYHEQQVIDVTNAKVGALNDQGQLTDSDLPTSAQAKYAPKDPRNERYKEYTEKEKQAIENAEASLDMQYDDGMDGQASVFGETTDADIDQMLYDADQDYADAVAQGDMDLAQQMVDEKAKETGYTIKAYHGTPTGGFTEFDLSRINNGRALGDGIYFSSSKTVANQYTRRTGRTQGENNPEVYDTYLNLGANPYTVDVDEIRKEKPRKPALVEYLMLDAVKKAPSDATSIVINGIYDGSDEKSTVYIIKNPSQIKSSDPVTYDDQGDVIPLSERFNDQNNDIRYSAGGDLTDADIDQMLIESGAVGQQDVDEFNSPLRMQTPSEPGEGQRQWGMKGAQQSDELNDYVKQWIRDHNEYTKDTNADQVNRAIEWIRSGRSETDPDGYQTALAKATSNTSSHRSKDWQARVVATMGMAVAKNDVTGQVELAKAYNKMGTDAGQALQARKLWRLMTPEGRVTTMQKMLQDTQDELNAKGKNINLKFSDWIYRAAAAADGEGDFQRVQKAAAVELAEQIPANWKDKLRGWRMLSMLGNPRTHIRNVFGNFFFEPVVGIKNKMGALAEIVTRQDERTKTLAPFLNKTVREFAKQDAIKMKDTLTGEAKYNDANSQVQREQKPFKGLLQAMIDFNSNALEAEDWAFLKGHYKRALGGWMQANGYTAEQLQGNPDLLEKGRAYAIQEAQKATYRDFSKLASQLNNISRGGGVAGFIVDAALPFKKTPANILKRGIEYSPAGLLRSFTADLYHLKQWKDAQRSGAEVIPEKAISPTQFIDRLCSGLTGTGIAMVGALLANAGIVTCGLDDDDDKFEKEQGNQEYAFKFSIAGHDFTYTMDWAAPMSMPFFVGAAIQQQIAEGGSVDLEFLINAFGNITEPVFNLSMLDGVNTLFKTSQYDDTNTITQIGAKIASNYATSYVPSLLGAITRTFFDDTRRKAFVPSDKSTGVMGTFRYAAEQTENKIPGLSRTNIPYRDIWGNAETSGLAERIIENFISPGYVTEYKNDPIINEMARLYDVVEDNTLRNAMVPSDPAKSLTYKKKKYTLTAEQWDAYKEARGKAAYEMLNELINTQDYQDADETTQAQMIKDAWSYADNVGKAAFIPDFDLGKPVTASEIASSGKVTSYKTKMIDALEAGDFEGYEAMVEGLRQEGVSDADIKEKVGNKYRDLWKDAYRKDSEDRMSEIEDILDHTDFDFNIYGDGGWATQVNNEND